MKTLHKFTLAASLLAAGPSAVSAQAVGAACGCPSVSTRPQVNISTLVDGNGNLLNPTTTLSCQNTYILNTRLYVNAGQDLIVEPGSVIKGVSVPGAANAIVVARQGQIWANGSESCPIIMTALADPLDGSYAITNRGQWGSLIILGQAYTNKRSADGDPTATGTNGVGTIEGLAAGDSRHLYGMPVGTEINNDNSGVLRYVSLRHGGQVIGANNEINGLTLGGVGSGTTLDHIEVISNLDDGFEFFGGTVNAKYLVAMHCDDDYIDWDQGYTGRLQFVYGVQGPDNSGGANNQGDNGIEADGDDASTNFANGGLRSTPQLYNATFIARNLNDVAIEAKERTQGTIVNSIFARFAQGLNMTSECAGFWNAGQLTIRNSTFQEIATPLRINSAAVTMGPDFTKFTVTDGNQIVGANALIDATYAVSGSTFTDRVNPVPAAGTASSTATPPATEPFFCAANYRGAFEPGKPAWTANWTLASQTGLDVSAVAGCDGDINGDGVINGSDFSLFVNAFGGTCF